jgi:hypothetical protein
MSKKDNRTILTPTERDLIWSIYLNPQDKEALCPMCNSHEIYCTTQNAGFEAAHIVAHKYQRNKREKLDPLFFVPCCRTCNNDTQTCTVFDFLIYNGYRKQLRRILRCLYVACKRRLPGLFRHYNCSMSETINALFGQQVFGNGGIQEAGLVAMVMDNVQTSYLEKRRFQIIQESHLKLQSIKSEIKAVNQNSFARKRAKGRMMLVKEAKRDLQGKVVMKQKKNKRNRLSPLTNRKEVDLTNDSYVDSFQFQSIKRFHK